MNTPSKQYPQPYVIRSPRGSCGGKVPKVVGPRRSYPRESEKAKGGRGKCGGVKRVADGRLLFTKKNR